MADKKGIALVVHAANFGDHYGLSRECVLRLEAMFREYQKLREVLTPVTWVIPAGSRKKWQILSEVMKDFLVCQKNVPKETIYTGIDADNTHAEVLEALRIIQKNGLPKTLIVGSSNYHVRRVSLLWRKLAGKKVAVKKYVKAPHQSSFKYRFLSETISYIKVWAAIYKIPILSRLLPSGPKWV